MDRNIQKIHFVASKAEKAQEAYDKFVNIYGNSTYEEADVIVILGGDGFMLQNLHQSQKCGKPLYGMNCGSSGFLMNEYRIDNLIERLSSSIEYIFHPLNITIFDQNNSICAQNILAINEVSIIRKPNHNQLVQAAKLKVIVDNQVRLPEIICDGLIIATPIGSTAYNFSALGPILPLGSPHLVLTPVSPCKPRRWHGAILPNDVMIEIQVLEQEQRPVIATADRLAIEPVSRIQVIQSFDVTMRVLSDPNKSYSDRILAAQFPS
ncbi:NAD kinase [Candidatus Liberibacter africanus]|uniref:NAD kinase n=1 Tax=Candidatus Liberibacter africanus PTSAPSY TaxID=1277257 RepID=A0A0G3I8I7_LIBAF|nr:NAD kinase [Candidatus Liberibacter africanus]AKK20047.1 inorganic polyphosphate/ATP-NAD kinase [Candidatus Liberibacter africanus PTSAPSY]QTP63868.1 NAD kinase [Candidatus Liberibacter africanus]